jgi:hypothetical protein
METKLGNLSGFCLFLTFLLMLLEILLNLSSPLNL